MRIMDTEYFVQHIQCTRDAKNECLVTVRKLLELAFAARRFGLLKMDELIEDRARFPDQFLRKAVSMVVEISDPDKIREVLYNYIFTSSYVSNQQFLNWVLITETMIAISQSEDLDFVFTYLVPSFFGFEYDVEAIRLYRQYKQSMNRQ
ncbi:MAG: hypothetical protein HFG20_06350 [Anaerotruncus sp.]|nr:hypothetical protein [Anaerotruncus sp.]